MNYDDLWNEFLSKIKDLVSSLSFTTWFVGTKLWELKDNKAIVIVPAGFYKKNLAHYKQEMENVISNRSLDYE